jgi:AbrB family looped-hinge helix DNA binding protein
MSIVTISPKYQIVIPREIREQLKLRPGQKVQAFAFENRIEFVPVRPAKMMRGFSGGSIPRPTETPTGFQRGDGCHAAGKGG